MAYNRSFRFYGIGFGPTPAEIIAEVNGVEVYSGPIATLSDALLPVSNPYDLDEVIFTLDDSSEFNTDFSGNMPISITVTNGVLVIFTKVLSNRWGTVPNPAFTSEQYIILDNPASTQEEIANVLIASANPVFSADEEVFLLTCDFSDPVQAAEVNVLRQDHHVEYSVHDVDSWEECIIPPATAPGIAPWYIQSSIPLACDLEVISFS